MPPAPLQIQLSSEDHEQLRTLLSSGVQPVRSVFRAHVLIQMVQGVRAPQIARFVPFTPQQIRQIGHRFEQGGSDRALYDKRRPGAVPVLTFLHDLRSLDIVVDNQSAGLVFGEVRRLAAQKRLSGYDAAYLELAIPKGLPLATLDEELRQAAVSTGVVLLG